MTRLFFLACGAVWRREMIHFWRERSRVFGFVGSPLIFWLVIGSGFGNLGQFFAGSLLLSIMFTAVFSTMSVIEDRRDGFLLAMLAAPAPRCAIVVGKLIGGASMATIQGVLFCLFLPLAGGSISAAMIPGVIGSLFLAGLAFTALGFWMAWKSKTPQGFHAIMNIVLMPLWMISGALFTSTTAHSWVQVAMRWNPLTYFMAVLQRGLMSGTPWPGPSFAAGLVVTALFGAFFMTASVYAVERRPQGVSS